MLSVRASKKNARKTVNKRILIHSRERLAVLSKYRKCLYRVMLSRILVIIVDERVRSMSQAQANLDLRLSLFVMSSAPAKNLRGIPDVRPKIHRPIHDKSHKISTQIRTRKRSSYVESKKVVGLEAWEGNLTVIVRPQWGLVSIFEDFLTNFQ